MSWLEDLYDFTSYDLQLNDEVPPLIKKTSQLIAAVVQNQVDILRDLLDSPKWYNVTDKGGYNLLQIAIVRDNEQVFDYMMSIPDFPVEFVNRKGQTALDVSLCGFVSDGKWMSEHFALELVKKGVCIDKVCYDGNTSLHCALDRSYVSVAILLMEAGVDVNIPNDNGHVPLDSALRRNNPEPIMALLIYGAEPSFEQFSYTVRNDATFLVQENLFLFLFDEYPDVEVDLYVLLKLAERKSPLFDEIIKLHIKVYLDYNAEYSYFQALCSMTVDSLKTVIKNFEPYISPALARSSCLRFYLHDHKRVIIAIENLNVMLESNIRYDVIEFFNTLKISDMFGDLFYIGCSESTIKELYCFLLSYGLNVNEMDFQLVYCEFGYCQLFKILLHMDIKFEPFIMMNAVPLFIYDVNMNLEKFLAYLHQYNYPFLYAIRGLFRYFNHPALRALPYKFDHTQLAELAAPLENLPKIPLLVELSRNAFRKFFIEKFQIKTSKQFFTLLKALPISEVNKKIISYEKQLYYYR